MGRRLLILGDSITYAAGASNGSFGYPTMAAVQVGTEAAAPVLRGFSGERSDEIVARVPALLIADAPKALHLRAGTNDASQNISAGTFMVQVALIESLANALEYR